MDGYVAGPGAGKRLFEGFEHALRLEPVWVLRSPFATPITYRVLRGDADAG
ncbi:MAG TPA: hypothetical protein VHL78_08180 [Actinomycetota bacterium]|nr:hypothetical protein [Actinomycetota bacterium]